MQPIRGFGAAAMRPTTPGGRIKVTDHMIWVNVLPLDGVPRRYAAYKGESLLDVLTRHSVPGIFADDLGGDRENQMKPYQVPYDFYSAGVRTGQDAVHIPDPWFDKLNAINSSEEQVMSKRSQAHTQNTRLASCIRMMPDLNEMIVVIANNRTVDGEWFTGSEPDAI